MTSIAISCQCRLPVPTQASSAIGLDVSISSMIDISVGLWGVTRAPIGGTYVTRIRNAISFAQR